MFETKTASRDKEERLNANPWQEASTVLHAQCCCPIEEHDWCSVCLESTVNVLKGL